MEDLKAKLQEITTVAKEKLKLEREAAKKIEQEKAEKEDAIAKSSAESLCEIAVANALAAATAGKSRIEIGKIELSNYSYSTRSLLFYAGDRPSTIDKEDWRNMDMYAISQLVSSQFESKVDFYMIQMLVNDYSMSVFVEYQHDGVGEQSWHMLVLEW